MIKGLRPKKEDKRDFRTGQVLKLPELSDIPERLVLGVPKIKDQFDSDFCAAFASTSASEFQEGIELSPEYQMAITKMIEGDLTTWGSELRDVCKGFIKVGSLPQHRAPYSLKDKSPEFLKDIKNWEKELILDCAPFKKQSFLSVAGQYDSFDDIRATMTYFHNKGEKTPVLLGVEWGWGLKDIVINTIPLDGFGHAVYAFGFDGDYLLVANSASEQAGDKGVHRFHRNIINHFVPIYGAYVPIDIPRSQIEYHVITGTKVKNDILSVIYHTIIKFLCILKASLLKS